MSTQTANDAGIVDYDEAAATINPFDEEYHRLLRHILDTGVRKTDRTGTGTISVFGYQMRFDLSKGFPLLTTKKVHLRSIIIELLWFLRGDTNIKYLKENGVTIWDEWADANGELGPVYGAQWRRWPKLVYIPERTEGTGIIPDFHKIEYIDQILEVVRTIKTKPDDRRLIVSAWNVAEIPRMKLPPCHALFQFYTVPLSVEERVDWLNEYCEDGPLQIEGTDEACHAWLTEQEIPEYRLSCQLYQRSSDTFLGVPFNIASYSLLTMMMAQTCNMVAGDFVWTSGDTHLYLNHLEQVDLQLSRESRKPPRMRINPHVNDIFAFTPEDFVLEGYDPHPPIKAPVAV